MIDLVEEEEKVKMGKKQKTREGRNSKKATLSEQKPIKLQEGKVQVAVQEGVKKQLKM